MSHTTNQLVNNGKKLETSNEYFVKVFYNGICYFFFTGKDLKKIKVWGNTLLYGDFPNYLEYNRLRDERKLTETYLSEIELEQACRLAKFLSSDPMFGLIKEERALILVRLKEKAKQVARKAKEKQKVSIPPKEQEPVAEKVAPPVKKEKTVIVKMNSFSQLKEQLKDKFPETAVVNG